MKKGRGKRIFVFLLAVILVCSGCGSVNKDMASTESAQTSPGSGMDNGMNGMYGMSEGTEDSAAGEGESGNSGRSQSGQKIIYRTNLSVETKTFDEFIEYVNTALEAAGGHIESSQIYGSSYDSYRSNRNATIVARIPAEKRNTFIDQISDQSNVTSINNSSENITLSYVDTESHIETLKIEQERLLSLLEKAEKIEDIIALEERLSSVRYELQNYQSQKNIYDYEVEYSTVTMDIYEVVRESAVKDETIWDRMKSGFSDQMYRIYVGLQNFAVWFVSNIIFLIIWAVVIIAAITIIKKIWKKKRIEGKTEQKKIKTEQEEAEEGNKS